MLSPPRSVPFSSHQILLRHTTSSAAVFLNRENIRTPRRNYKRPPASIPAARKCISISLKPTPSSIVAKMPSANAPPLPASTQKSNTNAATKAAKPTARPTPPPNSPNLNPHLNLRRNNKKEHSKMPVLRDLATRRGTACCAPGQHNNYRSTQTVILRRSDEDRRRIST